MAIARANSGEGRQDSGTSLVMTANPGATKGYLSVWTMTGAIPTGVTFNGNAMSLRSQSSNLGIGAYCCLWGIATGSTGSQNIVVSLNGTDWCTGIWSAYDGVDQSNPYDGTGLLGEGYPVTYTSISKTTTGDNEWVVGGLFTQWVETYSGETEFQTYTGNHNVISWDTGVITPAGSVTISASWGTAGFQIINGQAIRPASAGGGTVTPVPSLAYLGVG